VIFTLAHAQLRFERITEHLQGLVVVFQILNRLQKPFSQRRTTCQGCFMANPSWLTKLLTHAKRLRFRKDRVGEAKLACIAMEFIRLQMLVTKVKVICKQGSKWQKMYEVWFWRYWGSLQRWMLHQNSLQNICSRHSKSAFNIRGSRNMKN